MDHSGRFLLRAIIENKSMNYDDIVLPKYIAMMAACLSKIQYTALHQWYLQSHHPHTIR